MAENTPRELGGRYEVGELIGRGGMAEVHIGHDKRLGRTVAIKILRSDLARDPAFLARFAKEAQSAAALNHPAIVAVYDTGEDILTDPVTGQTQHVPYIVMEYVEGHTVREILNHGDAVPIDEAVEITSGVLSALSYSHQAGIIHRDIKPGNVMITPTGAVKVMDFGIARAVADSAMTQTQAVIGTAQYLSPEQARGETVDTRSDIYSTGCLLFELLTGRPPFVGDSPVAVAYQHVGQNPQAPSDIAADVPPDLDRITLKALAKERGQRYSTAAEFQADLENFLAGSPVIANVPEPQATRVMGVTPDTTGQIGATTVMGAATGIGATTVMGAPGNMGYPTTVLPPGGIAAAPGAPDATRIHQFPPVHSVPIPTVPPPPLPGSIPPGQYGQYGAQARPGYGPTAAYPPVQGGQTPAWGPLQQGAFTPAQGIPVTPEKIPSNRGKILLFTLLPLLVIGAGLATWYYTREHEEPPASVVNVTVPMLETGVVTTNIDACAIIEAVQQPDGESANLLCDPRVDGDSNAPVGTLVRQEPIGGMEVPVGSTVVLWFSAGPNTIAMDNLAGQTVEQATANLEGKGLEVGEITPEADPSQPEGHVIRTNPPAHAAATRGDRIQLFVSNGLIPLPDLRGMTENQAMATLNNLRLTPEIRDQITLDQTPGTIVAQEPEAGDIPQGSDVVIYIAKAPEPEIIPVPDIVGQPWTTAQDQLVGLNPQVGDVVHSDTIPAGYVVSTNPVAGTEVEEGTVIEVTLSSGPDPNQQQPPSYPEPTYTYPPGGGGYPGYPDPEE